MTANELVCLEQMVFFNECAGEEARMLTWNEDEAFPSFGVGHFIWYPKGPKPPYRESFTEYLEFMEAQQLEIPDWIKNLPTREAPWESRQEFLDELGNERMTDLLDFLIRTRRWQTIFIMKRATDVLPKLLATVPEAEHLALTLKFNAVAGAPNGMFAIIDYINFKGEGLLETERFRGEGWGLLQVLQQMDMPQIETPETEKDALQNFVRAAMFVLERRTQNAPPDKDCSKRICGWKERVKKYLTVKC